MLQAARNLTTGSNNVFVGVDAKLASTNSIGAVVLGNSSTTRYFTASGAYKQYSCWFI